MSAEEINNMANWIALSALIPFGIASIVYGAGAPWYKTILGSAMFAWLTSVDVVLLVVLARRWFGAYPGYEWVAITAYSYLTLAGVAVAAVMIVERRRAGYLTFPIRRRRKDTP